MKLFWGQVDRNQAHHPIQPVGWGFPEPSGNGVFFKKPFLWPLAWNGQGHLCPSAVVRQSYAAGPQPARQPARPLAAVRLPGSVPRPERDLAGMFAWECIRVGLCELFQHHTQTHMDRQTRTYTTQRSSGNASTRGGESQHIPAVLSARRVHIMGCALALFVFWRPFLNSTVHLACRLGALGFGAAPGHRPQPTGGRPGWDDSPLRVAEEEPEVRPTPGGGSVMRSSKKESNNLSSMSHTHAHEHKLVILFYWQCFTQGVSTTHLAKRIVFQ